MSLEFQVDEMIGQQTVRLAGLNNPVPTEVLLEVIGSAIAMFLLGLRPANGEFHAFRMTTGRGSRRTMTV